MRFLVLSSLFLTLLCTCDRAPVPLFQLRTDTGLTSANRLRETEEFNIVEYLYYYNGGGVAATDINGDGLPDLYFTNNQGPNKYYINEGDFRFRDATEQGASAGSAGGGVAGAGDWSTGVSVVDVDRDGLMDIYVCNVSGYKGLTGRNELFLQNNDGTFTEAAADYGLDFPGFNTQAYWFDYDLDGDLDMYLLRHSVHNDATYGTAAGREKPDSLAGDLLLRNDDSDFTNVTQSANLYSSKIGYGLSASIADFNQDGYPDIYVCNDFSENDYCYLNQGDGTFRESIREMTGHTSNFSMGSDAGDIDGDGRPDLFTLDMRPWDESILKSTMSADQPNVYNLKRELGYYDQLPHNALQWNRGGGNFSEIAELAGVAASDWSWSCLIEDFDLDGHPDIFVANGIERRPNSLDYLKFISSRLARSASNLEVIANMPDGRVANRMFRNTGELAFEDVAPEWGLDLVGSSTGAATADFDGDGDLDLVLNNLNAAATIYENTAADEKIPAERVALEWNPVPLAAQRGMLSQSGAAEVHIAVVPPKEESMFTVRGSGIVREGREGSYFDGEPLVYGRPVEEISYWQVGDSGAYATVNPLTESYTIYEWRNGKFMPAGQYDNEDSLRMHLPLRFGWQGANLAWQRGPRNYLYAEPFEKMRAVAVDEIVETTAPTGIWQSVSWTSDTGKAQILAGNLGLNTVLGAPTPEDPVRLYEADFDRNGKEDPIMTYVRQGREFTVADKDELTAQLPGLKRNNLSYTTFSNSDFYTLFSGADVEPQVVTSLEHMRWKRDGRSPGEWTTLPHPTQITTLNTALSTPQGILLGGNKLEVLPRIGRQDAAALQLLEPDGTVKFVDLGGARNRLEVRQLVRLDDNHVLVVVAEGEHLILSW